MDYMLICGDEIALEGLDGCPPIKLWDNLKKRTPPFPMRVDDAVKNYLWTGIVESLDVRFYSLETPLPHIFGNDIVGINREKFKQESMGLTIDLSFNSFNMVQDGDIIGSCPEYETREDVTSDIRSVSGKCLLTLQQALERWGDHLVIVASQDMRQKALMEDHIDPTLNLTPIQYCLLEHVGQARTHGRLQRFMAVHLNVDAKHLFFMLKRLSQKMGLIRKQKSLCNLPPSNLVTNIIRLKRFCAPPRHKFDDLGAELCQFLATQPDQMISYLDLKKRHDNDDDLPHYRTIKKVREHLIELGHVKVVTIYEPTQSKYNEHGPKRCYLQLVTPLVLRNNEDSDDDDADADNEESTIVDNPNLVMELPITKQMYDLIDRKGPEGTTNMVINEEVQLFRSDRRAVIRFLKSKGYVKSVMTYAGKQTITRHVALPHIDESCHTQRIIEEQKKLDANIDEVSLLVAEESSTASGATPLDSPCPSPAPSLTPDIIGSKVTYRRLKRTNFIVNLVKEKKVIEGCFAILKAIQAEEEREGLHIKMDRRVVKKFLTDLMDKGMIKKLTTIIDVKDVSHNVEFYLHSSVNPEDPEVKAAIEMTRFRLSGDQLKSKHRKQAIKVKVKDEAKVSDEENVSWNHDLRFSYGYLAKFPRMQLIHEFLWQALFGVKQEKPVSKIEYEVEHAGIVKSGSTGADVMSHDQINRDSYLGADVGDSGFQLPQTSTEATHTEMDQQNIAMPVIPSAQESVDIIQRNKSANTGELSSDTHNYGWIGQLQSLPTYNKPLGWVRLNDLLKIMPFSVYCNTVGIIRKVDGVDDYYNDPNKMHTAFKDLPEKIRKKLKHKGRYKSALSEIFSNLMCAGLVTVEKPVPTERMKAFFHFNRGAIVLDTSKDYTIGEDKYAICSQDFPFQQFVFHEFSDVQAFWDDLKYICLRTSFSKHKKDKDRIRSVKFSDCKTELITEDNIVPPPGDAMGAAGLDSQMFSHLARNWSFRSGDFMKFRIFSSEKRKSQTETVGKRATKKRKTDTVRAPRPKTRKKRPLTDSNASPTKKQKVEENPTSTKENKTLGPLSVNSHLVAVDETDRTAMANKMGMRVHFSPENDKILILCKIALVLMGVKNYRNYYHNKNYHNLHVQIRNILHDHCKDSSDKTAPNCRKRLTLLMRNVKNELTVKVCVAEYSSMQEFAYTKDMTLPFNETFHSTVKKILELSKRQVSSLDDTSQLVSSIDELHNKYKVRKLAIAKKPLLGFEDPSVLGPPIKTIEDIRNMVAKDIIQITCQTQDRSPVTGYINKMFDDFDLDEITKAGCELKKSGVINRNKGGKTPKCRNAPWKLAAETVRLLEPSPKDFITSSTYVEAAQFLQSCFSAPVSRNRRKIIRLKEGTVCGGKVAACLSLLITGKISVEFRLPSEILSQLVESNKEPSEKDKSHTKTQQAVTKQTKATQQERLGNETEESCVNDKTPFIKPLAATDGEQEALGKPSKDAAKDSRFTSDDDILRPSDESDKDSNPAKVSAKKTPKTVSFSDDTSNVSKEPLKDKASSDKESNNKTTKKRPKNIDEGTSRLRNPFINNQALTHCRFDTTFNVSNTNCNLFTAKIVTNDNTRKDTKSMANRPTRTAKLTPEVQPLVMSKGYNTLDTLKVNNCEIIIRSRLGVAKDNNDATVVAKDSDETHMVAKETQNTSMVAKDSNVVAKDSNVVAKDSNDISVVTKDSIDDTPTVRFQSHPFWVSLEEFLKDAPTLEEYLASCRLDQCFNDSDAKLAEIIYDMANESEELGTTVVQLKELLVEKAPLQQHASWPLDKHLKNMCNNKLLLKVGSFEEHFILPTFAKIWSVTVRKDSFITSESEQCSTIETDATKSSDVEMKDVMQSTPLVTPSSSTSHQSDASVTAGVTQSTQLVTPSSSTSHQTDTSLNACVMQSTSLVTPSAPLNEDANQATVQVKPSETPVVTKCVEEQFKVLSCPWLDTYGQIDNKIFISLLHAVLSTIVNNPGITEAGVCKRFLNTVRPVSLSHVLEYLVEVGCITKHGMAARKPLLFSTDVAEVSYYIPVPDCIVTLAKLTQNKM